MTVAVSTDAPVARPMSIAPWLFTIAVFFSASLVFLVQPMVGKLVLPVLGGRRRSGTPAWPSSRPRCWPATPTPTSCSGSARSAARWRCTVVVLALAALALPLQVTELLGAPVEQCPGLWLLAVLALSIGAPFAVLSATAPLLQAWCAQLGLVSPGGKDAYVLYAASNLGSLIALVAYPMVVEPTLGLSVQAMSWSVAYGVFVLGLAGLAALNWRAATRRARSRPSPTPPPIAWREKLTWVLLAAAPSSLLVGVTAHITADVASAPFLWVMPLALYLLTFIIALPRASRRPKGCCSLQVALVAHGADDPAGRRPTDAAGRCCCTWRPSSSPP